ncbi:amidohydrolase family protein [Puniceicoccus vermicola]|uniref:Amidohydrolase n=1 Tax=Puniceicoccus vermicola TaxID=388746 RepID=A0A7X1B1V5_9BACT|nr:amidohydrolase family protein [Puniceicoccus vermicola]MBC2603939.1 amidohydrolase [Puniceicoccus vermicola]
MKEQTLPIIDTDVHHSPDKKEVLAHMPKALAARGLALPGGNGFGNPHGVNRRDATPPGGGEACSDPAYTLEHHFVPNQIRYGILHPAGLLAAGVSADYRYAAALCSAYNDYMLESWLSFDPRYVGAILVAPNWPEAAAREIRRLGGRPEFREIIMTSASESPLGREQYWPIYEAACEMGLPVAVHPGAEGNGISNRPYAGMPSSYFEWHTSLSQNYMGQIASLAIEGVFNQFPELKFVAIEGGIAWLPHLLWRLDKNWKALRELTPWLTEPPSELIRRHVRLTTQPIEEPEKPEHLLQIFDMIHAEETLMFSSDYPHWDGDDPRFVLPRKLDEAARKRIFYDNAAELYGLPPQESTVSEEAANSATPTN